MNGQGSVTRILLEGLKAGDDDAAQRLWEDYFRRLVGLARQKLGGLPRGPADSEDIALSAFDSFCRGAGQGRFPKLNDRDDLWQVLVVITARKAIDTIRRERAIKRGGGVPAIQAGSTDAEGAGGPLLEEVVGSEPTPSFAAEVAEQYRLLVDKLGRDELKQIAGFKLEGYTNKEIAGKLNVAVATVERKLALIRQIWEEAAVDHG
jgi:DNA-directed RNA polymerase specialized sigma24 family protein